MADRPTRLLLIDDDEETFLIVRHLLRKTDDPRFELDWAGDYETGLERLCEQQHDVYLLDYRLNHRDGLELMREAQRHGCRRPIIMLTGLGSRAIDLKAMKAGAADYLIKDNLEADSLERVIRYVLERHHLLETLEGQASQLRMLATELARAEERERRRIAQLLHDHLQQLLTAAKMRLQQAHQGLSREAEAVGQNVQHAVGILDEAIGGLRNLTSELFPPVLYDRGLAEALKWLGRHLGEQHDLKVEVSADPAADPEDRDLQAFLFQSVRELLLNAVKHGRANRVWIEMHRRNGLLTISAKDNGIGCEPDQMLRKPDKAGGFGLFSIQQRLKMLNGAMDVQGAAGAGCAVTLRLVVEETDNADRSEASTDRPEQGDGQPQTEEGETRPIRVMLVDDHRIVREGLAGILRAEPEIDLVVEASDGREAVEMVDRARPDVIVMDVSMPRMDGEEATRVILADHPQIRVIGLSMYEDENLARTMRKAGASAYLTKGGPASELIKAIRDQASAQTVPR